MSITDSSNSAGRSGTPPTQFFPDLCLYRLIKLKADQNPEAVAITAPLRIPLTYRRLCRIVEETVERLNSIGIGRNDYVATVLPNGPEAAAAFLGIAAGAACAPLNPRYRANEFDLYLRSLGAKALIVPSETDSPARAIAQKLGITVIELLPVLEAEAGSFMLAAAERPRAVHEGFSVGDDVAFVLHTSGTTARSKLVPLTHANICASVRRVQSAFELCGGDRYLNVTPLFYSQGLMLTIASISVGASVVCIPGFNPVQFFKWMEAFHPTWYSAAPAIHQAILAHSHNNTESIAQYRLRFIRSAAAPLPPPVRVELEKFFGAPVIESYGMTECYPISSNPLPPGTRKAGSVGLATGTEIAIIDGSGCFLAQGKIGEIVVRGPQLMSGYLNQATSRDETFLNGWFRTGDEGFLDEDGYLFVTGRLKEIINRGGEKISPPEVDEALLEHPAILEAVTFAIPHATLGEDVAAVVVLRDRASASEQEIRDFAAARLAPYKVPRQVLIAEEIPKSPTGKVQRIGLAEKLGYAGTSREAVKKFTDRLQRRTPTEKKLANIWAGVLGLSMVGGYDNFFDLGGNSMLAVQLIAQIDRVFGKSMPLLALFQAPTVKELANLLGEEKSSEPWSPLVPIRTSGSKPPFFWVHGESSTGFLAEQLGPDQPFYALTHQSLDGRPARYTEVESIAGYYLQEIRRVQSEGCYFLGGFSFGGTVAFEMAQQLKRNGEEVAFLVLLDSRFPGTGISDSPERQKQAIITGAAVHRHWTNLASLGTREQLNYLWMRVKGKIKDKIKESQIGALARNLECKVCLALGRRLPVTVRSRYILNTYHRARVKYSPRSFPGRALYIKTNMRSGAHQSAWGRLMVGGLDVHEVPGDHLDAVEEPHLHFWAGKLKASLRLAQEQATHKQSSEADRR